MLWGSPTSASELPVRASFFSPLLFAALVFTPAVLPGQTYGVSVTALNPSPSALIYSTGNPYAFRVQNEGAQDTWTLTCSGASSVLSVSCPSSVTLAQSQHQDVTVTYSTGNQGSGMLYLTASSANSSDQGWGAVAGGLSAGPHPLAPHYSG